MDRHFIHIVGFFHADERPIFSGFRSASVSYNQVWLGLPILAVFSHIWWWLLNYRYDWYVCIWYSTPGVPTSYYRYDCLRSSVVRTSVSDRRTFPGLCSICSGCVTTYVGITSAIGQPTRPTQPFILQGSINELSSELNQMSAVQVAPSGERSHGRGRYGVVNCRGNPVWSLPERLELKFHERRYTSTLYLLNGTNARINCAKICLWNTDQK